jgi:phosphoribosyl-ATP pyrophosphohydrolase/phosphoribosyl-AMP cyclohydrolase
MKPNFNKSNDGLVPAIIQSTRMVTFYSRSRGCIWVKGKTSGNILLFENMLLDCDNDSLLVKATPKGPTCHTGADTCFNEKNKSPLFLLQLEQVIIDRKANPPLGSYTASLFAKGINKIAQKVGEEAVELVIEAKDNNDDLFKNEAADLIYHYLILLQAKGFMFGDIDEVLWERHK